MGAGWQWWRLQQESECVGAGAAGVDATVVNQDGLSSGYLCESSLSESFRSSPAYVGGTQILCQFLLDRGLMLAVIAVEAALGCVMCYAIIISYAASSLSSSTQLVVVVVMVVGFVVWASDAGSCSSGTVGNSHRVIACHSSRLLHSQWQYCSCRCCSSQ